MTKDNGVVNIHGKEYQTVASRVQKFRELNNNRYSIVTEIIEANDKTVVMKASIYSLFKEKNVEAYDTPILIATGHAEESRTSSSINRTSALENCETSAIGRALAAFGMAGTEYASADEVANAITQQATKPRVIATGPTATDKQKALINQMLSQRGVAAEDQKGYMIEQYGVSFPLTMEGASFVIGELKDGQ